MMNLGEPRVFTLPTQNFVSPQVIIDDWERKLNKGFRPSKSRHLSAILSTTSAGAQRSGNALPTFLPRGITPKQALNIAKLIDPFDRALELTLSNRVKDNFWRVSHEPKVAKSGRRNVIRELTKIATTLEPAQNKLRGVMEPQAPAHTLHIPLIAFLVQKFNYPDKSLPGDLARGMKITGTIAKSNALATRATPAA